MCHPECISTLQLVAARLHDQATTSKEIQRTTETPLPPPPLVAILWSRAVTLELILILIYEVGELTLSATSLVVM